MKRKLQLLALSLATESKTEAILAQAKKDPELKEHAEVRAALKRDWCGEIEKMAKDIEAVERFLAEEMDGGSEVGHATEDAGLQRE